MLAGLDAFNTSFLANLNTTESNITRLNQQISSGVRVSQASDDPTAVAPIIEDQLSLDHINQVQTNLQTATTEASAADGALQSANSLLNQLISIATQASSMTNTSATDKSLAESVQGIQQQMIALANTSINGRYIFGGDDATTQPYTYLAHSTPGYSNNNATVTDTELLSNADGGNINTRMTAAAIFDNASAPGTLTGNTLTLTSPGATFVTGAAGTNDQSFTFNYTGSDGSSHTITATISASPGGVTLSQALSSLNQQLNGTGITAGVNSDGVLQFSGSEAFSVADSNAPGGTAAVNSGLTGYGAAVSGGTGTNSVDYAITTASVPGITAGTDTLVFTTSSGGQITVNLTQANTGNTGPATPASIAAATAATINAATAAQGIYAVPNANGTGVSLQSASTFSVTEATDASFAGTGMLGANTANQSATSHAASAPASSPGILQSISSLMQALQNGSTSQAQVAGASLKASLSQLNNATTFYGNVENWIQQSQQQAATDQNNDTQALSSVKDTDVTAAATQLSLDQTALEAALSAHGTLSVKSLFSYLG